MLPRSNFKARSPCRRPLNPQRPACRPLPTAHCLLPTAYCLLPTVCCLLLLLAGCSGSEGDSDDKVAERPLAGVQLRLAVVDDPALAAAAGRLRGEWSALTDCEFQVETITEKELIAAETLQHDAVICASYHIGPLAEAKLIAPIPKELLQESAGDRSDVFELVRVHVTAWPRQTYAVPLGSPVLTCYYRADLLKQLELRPPTTWAEYRELAERLASLADSGEVGGDGWCGTIEPLAPGWAGLVLLARAAPYAKHRDNYSTLFAIDTMEPLVSGPPFVRALEELVAAAESGPQDPAKYDPAAARAAFWQGKCGMALTWPTAADDSRLEDDSQHARQIEVGFVELPGSAEAFEIRKRQWEPRGEEEDRHVPFLGVAGRIGVVSQTSDQQRATFRLLLWLSGRQFSGQVSAVSEATTLFRQSHLETPRKWTEEPVSSTAARQYAEVTAATLRRRAWLCAPRIPGRSEYLAALDEAVGNALSSEQSAAEALQAAATRWREITKQRGPEKQRAAYLHSLGLP